MLNNLKALVVILVLAAVGYRLIRPFCLAVMSEKAFALRRNVWYALTIGAFLSPSFGLYALFAVGVLVYAAGREENLAALFVWVTFAVPNARFYIPTILINNLFDLTQTRLVTLMLMIPAISRWFKSRRPGDGGAFAVGDALLITFLGLQLALSIPGQSVTVSMRQIFLSVLDNFLIFYVFARLGDNKRVWEVLTSLFVPFFIMALVGIVEWSKGWLLYTGLSAQWGDPNVFAFLFRGDRLRAQASSGNTLGLGLYLAYATTIFMVLSSMVRRRPVTYLVFFLLAFGLYSTSSRGPWLTAVLGLIVALLLKPNFGKQLTTIVLCATLLLGVAYVSPLRHTVIDRLPIIGTADQDTIDYRQQLAELSWKIIAQHPFFGDPAATSQMESLRQGQGIIDIVNGYIYTLLFTGWVGMTVQGLFYGVALVAGWRGYRLCRQRASEDMALGRALLACFVGCLFFIAVAGTGPVTGMLVGLLVSYGTACRRTLGVGVSATGRLPAAPTVGRVAA